MNPKDLQRRLLDEGFRDRLIQYIEKAIKLDFDWNEEPDEIEIYSKEKWQHPGYQFPRYDVDEFGEPTSAMDWRDKYLRDAKAIAVVTETHIHTATCRKKGTACRFGFSGNGKELVEATTIDVESGKIELKRGNAKANNHNPLMAVVTRSNHDLKLTFASGYKSLQSMYYMTSYTSKFEDDTSDILAMDSAFKALENENVLSGADAKERIRRLIIRMNYIRQGSLQFSGAQVAAMILNIGREGTHYTNANFIRLNLYKFINHVQGQVSDFRVALTAQDIDEDNAVEATEHNPDATREVEEEVLLEDTVTKVPDVIEDYIFRGEQLHTYNLYEMYRNTESVPTSASEKEKYDLSIDGNHTHRGRPYNPRVSFQAQHSKNSSRWTIIHSKQMVPCILGIAPAEYVIVQKLIGI